MEVGPQEGLGALALRQKEGVEVQPEGKSPRARTQH